MSQRNVFTRPRWLSYSGILQQVFQPRDCDGAVTRVLSFHGVLHLFEFFFCLLHVREKLGKGEKKRGRKFTFLLSGGHGSVLESAAVYRVVQVICK